MFAFGRLAGRAGGGGDRECGIPDDHQAEFQEEAKLRPVFDALTKLGFKRRCGGTKSTRRAVVSTTRGCGAADRITAGGAAGVQAVPSVNRLRLYQFRAEPPFCEP